MIAIGQRSALMFWHAVVPLALTVLTLHFLVPDEAAAHVAPLDLFARVTREQPVVAAAFTFLVFTGLVQYWSAYLPGARRADAETGKSRTRRIVLVVAIVLAAGAGLLVTRPLGSARIVSTSMVPTILPEDRVWIDKRAYRDGSAPRRGDVVVFRREGAADGEGGVLGKRVIAVAGDYITMVDSKPIVNGREVPSCDAGGFAYLGAARVSRGRLVVEWLEDRPYLTLHERRPHPTFEYQVKPGEVFVLGDNRGVSNDSRSWQGSPGVALSAIEGRVDGVLFGTDRGGQLDTERVARRLSTDLHIPDVDIRPLREGIERCLREATGST